MGLAAGVWCGLSGMAPAVFLAPLLAWLLGARTARLGGSVLIVTVIASGASLLAYGQMHLLAWGSVVCAAVASVAGSLIGSLPLFASIRRSIYFRWFLSGALVAVGLWMLAYHDHTAWTLSHRWSGHSSLLLISGAGLLAGLFAALANVSGILIVPALFFLAKAPMLPAQAISLATLALVSALPAISAVSQQRYASSAAIWCGFGAALGALYGSRVAVQLSEPNLLVIYGAGLIVAALVSAPGLLPSSNSNAGTNAIAGGSGIGDNSEV